MTGTERAVSQAVSRERTCLEVDFYNILKSFGQLWRLISSCEASKGHSREHDALLGIHLRESLALLVREFRRIVPYCSGLGRRRCAHKEP